MRHKMRLAFWSWMTMAFLGFIVFFAPQPAHAAVVGRFTQVTGPVDLLKQGKLPAVAAKVADGVEQGDIIRTKSGGKAQLTMVDDSIITLAPQSRLAIADYQYTPARQERRVVLRFFRGLMQTVVKHIIKRETPDFIIETHTAIVGVRGSNPYFLLMPAFTTVYLPHGLLEVQSNNPNIPFQVMLQDMQFTQIPLGGQPFLPQALTAAMLNTLQQMMSTGIKPNLLWTGHPAAQVGGGVNKLPFQLPVTPDQKIMQQTVPPVLVPTPQAPPPAPPAPSHPNSSPSGGNSPGTVGY